MSDCIRVLHVFGALNPGGVETFVMNVYRSIDRSKVQFDFALTEGTKSFFDDEVLSMGGRIFYFNPDRSLMRNLSEILEYNGPFEAVHSHVYFYSGMVLRNARRHHIPVRIAHAHNTSFGQQYTVRRRIYERLMRKLILTNATHMFGCSEDACRFVFGTDCMDDDRCRVIHNGFDVYKYRFDPTARERIRRKYDVADSDIVIGHVGRFEEQKNHIRLIDQFAAVHRKNPNTVLLMVGRGSLMDSIREKCHGLNIADSCIFAGAQQDVASYYSAMDAFLFPSLYEGLGSVLIEAQANGLHVITSETVVPEDIDVTGNATFVDLRSSDEVWAETVLKNIGHDTRPATNEKVAHEYDSHKVAASLENDYLGNRK